MKFRNNWIDLTLGTQHTHWSLYYQVPSDDCDSWNTYRSRGEKPIYRAQLIFGFWKMFLSMYLWKVKPFKGSWESDNHKVYGITYFERSIHLHTGKTKVYSCPHDWSHVRHDLLFPNGDVFYSNRYKFNGKPVKKECHWYEILDHVQEPPCPKTAIQAEVAKFVILHHETSDGRKQDAKIRLTGSEREWRWRWLQWLPFPRRIKRTVECDSDIELGERAGEWKGGLVGWSCEWKHGESMEDSFWRWYAYWNGK